MRRKSSFGEFFIILAIIGSISAYIAKYYVEIIIISIIIGIPYLIYKILGSNDKKSKPSIRSQKEKIIRQNFQQNFSPLLQKELNLSLARTDPDFAQLVREIQIIKDSAEIIKNTKNLRTAQSRMRLIKQKYETIKKRRNEFPSAEVYRELCDFIETSLANARKRFELGANGNNEESDRIKRHIEILLKAHKKDEDCRIWGFNIAFDEIFDGIILPGDREKLIKTSFWGAFSKGDTRMEKKVLIELLRDIDWEWDDFDRWMAIFKKEGQYPYMWRKNKLEFGKKEEIPSDLDSVLGYLNVKELRQILKEKEIKVRPAPRKRAEFIVTIKKHLKVSDILPYIETKIDNLNYLNKTKEFEAKCDILAHTITMRSYHYAKFCRLEDPAEYEFALERLDKVCPMEAKAIEMWRKKEIDGLPPFFPGDRTGIYIYHRPY